MAEVMERIRRGEEVTISDQGRPVGKIVAVESDQRIFNAFAGRVVIADDFNEPLPPEMLAEFNK